jgi:hypothetical protein
MIPKYETFSAPPGKPSILWVGKSGRKYRTLVLAKIDKAENAYSEPASAIVDTNQQSSASPLIFVLIVAVVAIVIYKFLN